MFQQPLSVPAALIAFSVAVFTGFLAAPNSYDYRCSLVFLQPLIAIITAVFTSVPVALIAIIAAMFSGVLQP